MGSGNLYARPANSKKNVKGNRFVRSFLFAGLLLLSMPFASRAVPSFIHGSVQTLIVCQNSANNSFADNLTITDTANGITETWQLIAGPSHGTPSGLPFVGFADGGILTTAGTTPLYTPDAGWVGADQMIVQIQDQNGNSTTTVINIVISPLPSLSISNVAQVCQGANNTTLSYTSLANVGPASTIFYHTGGGSDMFIVPPSVSSIDFDVQGAVGGGDSHSGAANPGNGGRVQGTLAVTAGQVLYINSGGSGANGSPSGAIGGFNGGGNAYFYFFGCGGAGGGASDIRVGANTLVSRVVVAGGGGGNGWDSPGAAAGGDGGNLIGGSSANNVGGSHSGGGISTPPSSGSGGAHATYVGWTPGGNGTSGVGGDGSVQGISGGGGGGYFGGGGGIWTGGGGGSSFANPGLVTSPVYTSGYNIGDGIVSFNYNVVGHYDIIWTSVAPSGSTFTDVTNAILPATPITVSLDPTLPAGTYNAILRIHNNSCVSSDYPFSVTINPTPDVSLVANQTVCQGDTTTSIMFLGSVSGTTFNWSNDHPGIGLVATGSGPIPSFTSVNTTTDPLTALITVTPVANSCPGAPMPFTIQVNPRPTLTSTLSPSSLCDSAQFNYYPTSATLGTTFTWFRDQPSGIDNLPASGADNPGEYLYNSSPATITVPYLYTLAANGCLNSQTVNVSVYPKPTLTSTLSIPAECNNTLLNYTPSSATSGTTFMWNRNAVAGISNSPASGSSISEILHNTTTDSVIVPYVFTIYLTGTTCTNTQTVYETVYPSPVFNSPLATTPICDSQVFGYIATSATAGTTFSWVRPVVSGISNAYGSGITNTISENLVNTTNHPVVVTYNYTLTAHGCSNPQSITATVLPKPMLSSNLTPSVCDSALFSYTPTSGTTGTTFAWTRDTVGGITNAVGAGINNPNETLWNSTSHTVIATYKYTMVANGCSNVENVLLTVNPRPKLSSSLTPGALCDSATFNYPPTSNTAGASFSWYRPYIAGIYGVSQTGVGNPNQQLINSTYVVVPVTYNFTITANGCSNKQDVTVNVNPTPKLNPPYVATVCSGSPFHYAPASYTPGATFAWNRPAVAHIAPGSAFGSGTINETLVDDQLVPQHVDYIYRLSVNGCPNLGTQTVKVTINPAPQVPGITIYPDNTTPCNHTLYQNFGASDLQAPNVSYQWSATNATVYAEGTNHQNALINFNNPGTAVVTVNSNVVGYGCVISNSKTYTVGNSASDVAQVIYYNGQFICLKSDNATYQWGFDDAATLDSTILSGEINQSYVNGNPNFTDLHYWVMTVKDGCLQKSYFNAPTGINTLDAGLVDMKVYPNPAKELLNVEINSAVVGNLNVDVLNMLGQKVASETVTGHKAGINVAALPSGAYLVDCYRDGIKIATTRFIKN